MVKLMLLAVNCLATKLYRQIFIDSYQRGASDLRVARPVMRVVMDQGKKLSVYLLQHFNWGAYAFNQAISFNSNAQV